VKRSKRLVVAAVLFAAACRPPAIYQPAPEGSFTKADAALEIDNVTFTVHTAAVTPAFFPATHGAPLLGRLFLDGDRAGTGTPVVVLSSPLWQKRFGGDRAVIGRTVHLDGHGAVIVGVMPERFEIPGGTDIWTPQTARRKSAPRAVVLQ
jgi:hypothetical protein